MKLLILSSNNGQGHNTAAKAILECAEKRGDNAIMIDAMLFESPKQSELFEQIHIRSALRAPELFEKGTQLAERIEEAGIPQFVSRRGEKHSARLLRFIRDNGFDTAIATQVFAAQMLTFVEDRLQRTLATAFVSTDYCYIPFTSATHLDTYFLPHVRLLEKYNENAPGRNYIVSGIPTSEQKMRRVNKKEARKALSLPSGMPIALIMTGSMGFGDVCPLIAMLRKKAPTALITVLCGRNESLMQTLQREFSTSNMVLPITYTDKVGLYLDAADVLLSKPGGLSSTEAAVKGIPLVHITPLPGWEEENVRFFTKLGLSVTGDTPASMAEAAARLLCDRNAARSMVKKQQEEINPNAAAKILSVLDEQKRRL